MLNAGIDYHKRYSQVDVVDDAGRRRAAARLPNEFDEIAEFFRSLGEPCRAVLEAGWNWGLMHDWLEEIDNVTGQTGVRSSLYTKDLTELAFGSFGSGRTVVRCVARVASR